MQNVKDVKFKDAPRIFFAKFSFHEFFICNTFPFLKLFRIVRDLLVGSELNEV